jgi:isopropylmalate/isohomocitrate dehydrogenase-like protein
LKKYKIALIPGDGVGPEVIDATISVLDAVQDTIKGLSLEYELAEAGLYCMEKYGTNLPEETRQILRSSDCCLKGPLTTPETPGSPPSATVQIRKMFDLYANLRPCRVLPNVKTALKPDIDLVIVRENTEGLYSGIEFKPDDKSGVAIRIVTEKGCERIARFAFMLALKRKRHLTYVHKRNIFKITDGIFEDTVLHVAKDFLEVDVDDMRIDAATMFLIKRPEFYDVIVTTNMFGDIISDEAAQIVGGIGLVPGANIGEDYAMFEPIHGSAPKYTGKDRVNPIATILATELMFDWLNIPEAAEKIRKAVETVLIDGRVLTYDIASGNVRPAKCSEMGEEIASKIVTLD